MGKQLIEGVSRKTVFMVPPERLTIVGIDTEDGPEHRLWDERIHLPLREGMVLSITAFGVKENVVGEVDGDRILVINGRQRVLHAREANKRLRKQGEPEITVPVAVEKGDEKFAEMIAIALNEQRVDDPVMTKAAKAMRMKSRGHSTEAVALAFGVTAQTVYFWESIISAAEPVKKAVESGQLSPTAAASLSGLSKTEQVEALGKLVAEANGKKVTASKASAETKARVNGHDRVMAPSKKVLRRVIETGTETLSEDFIRGVRFAIGDLDAKAIAGLTALVRGDAE